MFKFLNKDKALNKILEQHMKFNEDYHSHKLIKSKSGRKILLISHGGESICKIHFYNYRDKIGYLNYNIKEDKKLFIGDILIESMLFRNDGIGSAALKFLEEIAN